MPSFVNRGVKMFDRGEGPVVRQSRSEGRMKRYESCTDLRAWCDQPEERRRYMLELMANPPSCGGGEASGRYVPFATQIELLQAMKDGQIVELQKKLKELEKEIAAYRSLKLTDEQRAQLQGLMGSAKKGKQDVEKPKQEPEKAKQDLEKAGPSKDSTTVLFKRKDDGHSSGADSDSDSQDLRKLLAERDAQIKALKSQLDAKNEELERQENVMRTAQEKVDSVSNKVDDNSQLRSQLEKTKDELNSLRVQYDELKRKSSNCDDVLAERDALRMRVKDYERMDDELEKLRYRAKEADVLRMERDRLKERVDELGTIETAYMKLLQETSDYEQMAAERELYKHKYEELAGANNDLEAMDDELKHLQGIEQERDYLVRELNELRCTIADQEDEIQRLLIMVEKLSAGNNNKEERMVKGLSSMRIEMDKRCERIMELEAQLEDLPALEEEIRNLRDQLKNTIVSVAQDKDRLSTNESKLRLELEESGKMLDQTRQEVSEYMEQLATLQRENDSLRSQMEALRALSGGDSELQDELVRERSLREQAEEALREALDKLEKVTAELDKAMSNMAEKQDGSKDLLEHSESKYLREKEAKDLLQGILDVTQDELENEKATRRALEERVKELEALLANTAKSSDSNRKLSLDMANEIEQLKAQLEAEKIKCDEAMMQGRGSTSSNDSKNMKIQAEADEKIQSLQKQVSELQAENWDLRNKLAANDVSGADNDEDAYEKIQLLQKQVSELQAENEDLKNRLTANSASSAGYDEGANETIQLLQKQISVLQAENEDLRNRLAAIDVSDADNDEGANEKIQLLQKQISALQAENEDLKNRLAAKDVSGADNDEGANEKIQLLQKQISALQAENEDLKNRLAAKDVSDADNDEGANEKIQLLQKQISALQAENEDLKNRLASNNASVADYDELRGQVAALEKQNAEANVEFGDRIKGLEKQIRDLQAENDALRKAGQSDDCSDLMAAAEAEKAQMGTIIKKLEAQLQTLANQPAVDAEFEDCAAICNTQLEKFKKKIAQQQAEIQKLQGQLESNVPADTGAELDGLRKKIRSLEAEIEQLTSENERLKAAIGSGGKSQADCEAEMENMRKKMNQLEMDKQNLQTKIESAAPSDTKAELDNLRKQMNNLEAENEKLKSGAGAKDNKAADCEKELENLQKKIGQIETEKQALQTKLDIGAPADARGELDSMRKKISALEAETEKIRADCEKEKDALRKKITGLEAGSGAAGSTAATGAELDSLRKICKGLEDENEKLKSELGSLKKKLGKLEQDNKDLQKAVDSKAPDDSRKELEDLRKKVAMLEAETERLKRDKKDLSDRNAKLSKSFEDRLANMTKTSLVKIQQSVEKFKGTLSPDDHARNIKETEDKYEQRLAKLKEEYERRLADMIEQNKRNTDQYSANLASLKEVYERDMKALNARHNESVLKFQKLHEQEIREINDNYAKELATIENSNDGAVIEVRKQSKDSIKNLKALHDSELDKLKKQYEDKINKLIAEHNEEKERLTNKLNMDLKDKDNKLRELEESKLGGQEEKGVKEIVREKQDELIKGNSAEETRLKYEAMLNRLTDSNEKKMKLLQERYEQLLEEERRKNAKAAPHLQLMKTDVHEVKPASAGPLSLMEGEGKSSDKLIAILNKILAMGIESLTFEELSFLHECICAASGKKILANPDLKLSMMSPELHGMDKKQLCSRIQILEKELTRRDKETQRKVCCLEKCIKAEKQRLDEVRQTLTHEQRRCVELGSRHDMMKKETANCADKARSAFKELERERAKCCSYEIQLKQLKAANKYLQSLLDNPRSTQPSAGKDADAMGAMRPTLDSSPVNETLLRTTMPRPDSALPRQNSAGQPTPGRKADQRGGVTYMDPLVQDTGPRAVYPTTGRPPCPAPCAAPCNVMAAMPTPRLQPGETRKLCPPTSVADKPYTELQMITQRDSFVNACSSRLASKKPKKGSK